MDTRENGHTSTTISDKTSCDICSRDSFRESLLRCHRCITAQHTFCLDAPLVALPDRRWLCPACTETSLYSSRTRRVANGRLRSGNGSPIANGLGMAHGSESNGPVSNGTGANGTGANGTVANGTVANGAVANGAVANGTVANGTVANGSVTPQIPASQRGRASRRRAAEEVCGVADAAGQNTPDTSDTPRASSTSDAERDPVDPGSTITIFCRRDFRRYMRWKRRELARQDDERKQEEQTRSRKSFSSIIANAMR